MRILPLTGAHEREQFDCGRGELNLWLRRIARQHQDKGLSRTYVAADEAAPARILAYYALTLTEIDANELPAEARRRFPRRIPGVRLGRLAVERGNQGKGLGSLLLVDAIERTRRVRQEAGGVGLFVDAIDEAAAGFYLKHGFSASPDNPLLLFFPVV
jgi:GNAT superfamily N-acetyltransferase